jgi:hypothetical protein
MGDVAQWGSRAWCHAPMPLDCMVLLQNNSGERATSEPKAMSNPEAEGDSCAHIQRVSPLRPRPPASAATRGEGAHSWGRGERRGRRSVDRGGEAWCRVRFFFVYFDRGGEAQEAQRIRRGQIEERTRHDPTCHTMHSRRQYLKSFLCVRSL